MAKKIISILIAIMLVFIPSAFAVDVPEIEAGLTPDSQFYFLDRWGEGLSLAFTFNNENKALKHLEFAQERLSEMKQVQDIDKLEELQLNYNQNLNQSRERTKSQEFIGIINGLDEKNQQLLNQVIEKVQEKNKKGN